MREDEVIDWIGQQDRPVIYRLLMAIQDRLDGMDVCEHGIPAGYYCEPCNHEYRRAHEAYEREMMGGDRS